MTEDGYAASHTSIYTLEKKKSSYPNLREALCTHCQDLKLRQVITDMLNACSKIATNLHSSLVTVEGSSNTFGDVQLSVDVISDKIMWEACTSSSVIREGASEEDPILKVIGTEDSEYTVCWDPLDGSSIVDNNWTVGTIIGIWGKQTGLLNATGRDQRTSIVVAYGPRVTALVALDNGVYEFSYLKDEWICTREQIQIQNTSKIFSPANLRSTQELPGYKKLVEHYMTNRRTLRYTGGLVPDVYQQFTKRQGIFTNPTSPKSPAKLRLAFEAAPLGLLVEMAGGKSSDGVTGGSILDVKILGVDQRTPLCCGSASEVTLFNEYVLGLSSQEQS